MLFKPFKEFREEKQTSIFQMETYFYNLKYLENNFSEHYDVQNQNSKRIVYELFN